MIAILLDAVNGSGGSAGWGGSGGSALPGLTHVAQLLLAGTVATHVGVLRPATARADLLLEAEMVHADLRDQLAAGWLPASDPQVLSVEQLLGTLGRLPRRTAARALVLSSLSRTHRWPAGAGSRTDQWWHVDGSSESAAGSDLSAEQLARLSGCLLRLDAAVLGYLRVVQPWRWLRLAPAARHPTGQPTTGQTTTGQPTTAPSIAAADLPDAAPTSGSSHPADRPARRQARAPAAPGSPRRHVRIQTRALVRAALRPDETPSVPISAGEISAAISRSQGVTVEPGSARLDDLLPHH